MIANQTAAARNETGDRVGVKICGLTQVDQAEHCARLGADLIGLVFYPGSPRCIDSDTARDISLAVRSKATTVGVFVNESYRAVMEMAQYCGLRAVQLHGCEPPDRVQRLGAAGLVVLKALFHEKEPFLGRADDYDASAYLLECGAGRLPGGNARSWDWTAARKVNRKRPVVLAGGLSVDNISLAIRLGKPDAVDVSSGVERRPGVKDMQKVAAFIDAAKRTKINYHPKPIR